MIMVRTFVLLNPIYLVFTFGSAEKGQLGNGTTGERITTGNKTAYDIEPSPGRCHCLCFGSEPLDTDSSSVYVKELDGKKIVQIASGPQHSLAVDDTGYYYVRLFFLILTFLTSPFFEAWCMCGGTTAIVDLGWVTKWMR